VPDEAVEAVIVKTLETTPKGETHWSTRTMAKAAGMSHTMVGRIWRTFGLQPHVTESFKLSPDPQLVAKVRDVATGEVLTRCTPQHRAQDFVAFLRDIDASVEPALEIHVVLDNLSAHKAPAVHRVLTPGCSGPTVSVRSLENLDIPDDPHSYILVVSVSAWNRQEDLDHVPDCEPTRRQQECNSKPRAAEQEELYREDDSQDEHQCGSPRFPPVLLNKHGLPL
jgi:hypothetical protein